MLHIAHFTARLMFSAFKMKLKLCCLLKGCQDVDGQKTWSIPLGSGKEDWQHLRGIYYIQKASLLVLDKFTH